MVVAVNGEAKSFNAQFLLELANHCSPESHAHGSTHALSSLGRVKLILPYQRIQTGERPAQALVEVIQANELHTCNEIFDDLILADFTDNKSYNVIAYIIHAFN